MSGSENKPVPRLGQQADPPFMIQPPGCRFTPDEVGRMLGNRVVQPHYAAWLVRKAIEEAGTENERMPEELKHYRMAAEAEASLADRRQQEIDRLRAMLADATERMVVLERQRDDYLSREWQAERAKRQAETERDANQLDASRYRGMRDRLPWTITSSPVGLSLHFEIVSKTAATCVRDSEENELDAAVDAFLEAPQE